MLLKIRTYATDRIELAPWSFWPEEWKRSKHSRAMINARLETAAEKPMFSSSFSGRHCMVLADGYYEWRDRKAQTALPHHPEDRRTLRHGRHLRARADRIRDGRKEPRQLRDPHSQSERGRQLHSRADARHPSARPREGLAAAEPNSTIL